MGTALEPIKLADLAWQSEEVCRALSRRDMAAIFRYVQRHSGASQARLAVQVGMTQGRVNEIINGRRLVTKLDVFERIADGLNLPDGARRLLGLAPSPNGRRSPGSAFDLVTFPEIARVYSDQASATAEIQRAARSATELDVLAVRGLGLLALRDSLLRQYLDWNGDPAPRLRVLLLDPDSPAAERRAAEIGESTESLAGGIRLAEARLRELAGYGRVEVYRYSAVPVWRIIRLDRTLFVGAFDADWEGHESATYKVLATPHGPLYRGWRRQFDVMVDGAERVI
ncbi:MULTISPECIES: helix-turn-helix domain-containing protein [unclassified Kitasatospora]|uniref:helix-turn-helix domain-containing protein n=1 Tax=unclassified Kitasatospora TaxID=2633591 RepID=UPI00382AB586